jgi:hypothetical protein
LRAFARAASAGPGEVRIDDRSHEGLVAGDSSGAGSGRGPQLPVVLATLAIAAVALCLIASPALADPPSGTLDSVTAVSYSSVHLTGTVHPVPGGETYWRFDYSTDGVTWVEGPGDAHGVPVTEDPASVEADITGLKGGNTYFVRLAMNNVLAGEPDAFSPEPNAEFETLPVEPPSVLSIADAAGVSYTGAEVAGRIERPANTDPAFDAACHFEYVTDQQFTENQGNGVPAYEGAGSVPCGLATPGEDPVTTPGPSDVTADLSGLAVGTTYHLRLAVSNAGGSDAEEAPDTFTTLVPAAPVVSIDPVTTFTDTTAHLVGHINPGGSDPAFDVHWEFHCQPECPGLAGDIDPADANLHEVQADATGLEPNTEYKVELIAANSGGRESHGPLGFRTKAVGPGVETLPAFAIQGGTEALVGGRINPKNSATRYWIEYGTSTTYGASLPTSENADAGSGGHAQIFTQRITGLTPGTLYYVRLVAKNAGGKTQGHDANFETAPAGPTSESCPNDLLRSENDSTELPDCRAYEQVSPVDKNGFDAGANSEQEQNVYVASEDGSALAFESFGAFGDAKSATEIEDYISRRGTTGWTTHGLNPAGEQKTTDGLPQFNWYSPDLGLAYFDNPPGESVATGADPSAANIYLRDNATDTFQTLSLGGHEPTTEYRFGGASKDGKRIFFSANAALTLNAPGGGVRNIYEWNEGQLRLASIEPGEIPASGGASLGFKVEPFSHQVSEDGSRLVFRDDQDGQLYLREDGHGTVEISASRRATPDPVTQGVPLFVGASADGSEVYFTDNAALTEDAQLDGSTKLYRYDAVTKALTDLSAPAIGREEVESVAAVSNDGSFVYFKSSGHFHPGENEGGQSGLYLWHNGALTFVGSNPGEPLGTETQALYTTYRLSPDGRYLSFATANRMTSYDNTDAVTGEPDTEVYVYSAESSRLTCVSCNPAGLPPTGTPDGASNFPMPPTRQNRNPQPGVSDEGRVFFNSRDALVPQDTNGKQDVYEWEGGRVHLISSGVEDSGAFLVSSSVSGDDVFINTRAQLIAADRDENADLYDARVGGGFASEVSASLCGSVEECHGRASSPPAFADPRSATDSFPSRPLSPGVRRLRKALKACKKRPERKRARCRAAAKRHRHHTSARTAG